APRCWLAAPRSPSRSASRREAAATPWSTSGPDRRGSPRSGLRPGPPVKSRPMPTRFPDHPDLFADPPPEVGPASSLRGKLYTIAPHAAFLPTLADRILDGTLLGGWRREGPFWL